MEVIAGPQKVTQILENQMVIDMEAKSAWLDQDSYPFETLTRKVPGGIRNATRMKHEFRERRLIPMTAQTTAIANAAATTIAVDDTTIFYTDQLIYCPTTGEMFSMAEDVGGTAVAGSITIRRLTTAAGTGLVTAIPAGSILVNLGESHAEGEAIPASFATQEETFYTYCYQFDRTRESTDIAGAEEKYGESEVAKQRRQFWIEKKRELNMMMYLGQQTREILSGASGARRHVMRGLREYLDATAVDATTLVGGLTLHALGNMLRPTMVPGSSSMTKMGICGQNAWSTISAYPDALVRIKPGADQTWGVTLAHLTTPFGNLDVTYDKMLSAEYGLAGDMYTLDMGYIYQIQLQTKPLVMLTNRVNPTEIHTERDVITGTRGLVVKLPELHRRIYGISL